MKILSMSQEQGTFAVCAKLLGSDESRGETLDAMAGQPENHRLNRMERVVFAYGGKLARKDRTMLLASFSTADAATLAACEMQRRCFGMPRLADLPLSLHIGVHRVARPFLRRPRPAVAGERRDSDRRYGFGTAIRLAEKAPEDGILLSDLAYRALMQDIRNQCRPYDGPSVGIPVYDLDWRKILSLQTHAAFLAAPPSPSDKQLVLRVGANRMVLDCLNTVTSFGRDPACDVIVPDKLVSREHACIELRPEGCLLTDHSTNGTNILFNGGYEVLVKNKSFLLEGQGRINLARVADRNSHPTIEFRVQDAVWMNAKDAGGMRARA
jgi:hypothetical protein